MPTKILIFSLLLTFAFATLKKCNPSVKFGECLATLIEDVIKKAPIKEIGLPVLDPLEVESLVIPPGQTVVTFEQKYHNIKVKGLSQMKCNSTEVDYDSGTLKLECCTPSMTFDFQYEVDGKVLMLPVVGKGPGFVGLEHLDLQLQFTLTKYQKNGREHYKIVKTQVKCLPQKIKFRFDNLFNGDKIMSENVNKLLNDNWSEVFNDVRSGYEDAIGHILSGITNKVLENLPISELFKQE